MSKIMTGILLFLMYLLNSCSKEPIDNIGTNTTQPTFLWQIPILPDTSQCSVLDPHIVVGTQLLLFGGDGDNGHYHKIATVDMNTGNLTWITDCEITTTAVTNIMYGDLFIGMCSFDIVCYDIPHYSLLWTTPCNGGYQISNFNNKIFNTYYNGWYPSLSSSLVMADISTGVWDTVYTQVTENNYSSNICLPGVFINNLGDTILYFQNRQWNFTTVDGKIDLYAYNMTKDSLLWVDYDISRSGNSSIQPPFVYENKLYFRGDWTQYCFDATTGEMIWDHTFGETTEDHLLDGNSAIIDGKLIVNSAGHHIYAFDPDNGDIIWRTDNSGSGASKMIYYNGAVYYGSVGDGKIHVIDIHDGHSVRTIQSPIWNNPKYDEAYFGYGVAIDTIQNRLYTGDSYFLYCIKIDW